MIEGWELGRVLRAGGLGSWRLAHRPHGYRDAPREDAIAWVAPGPPGDPFTELFMSEEGWLAERVEGPVFQRVFATGTSPAPYLLAERVDAVPVRRLLARERALDVEAALAVTRVLLVELESLAALRAPSGEPLDIAGVGLGPDQVWLTPSGVRLANPFIVRAVPTSLRVERRPAPAIDHLAPEAVRGLPRGAESDVFAAAVTLAALLIGRSPFGVGRRPTVEVLAALMDPDRAPVRDALAEAPPNLRAAILHALEVDPKLRPPTPRAFLERLDDARLADGSPAPRYDDAAAAIADLEPEIGDAVGGSTPLRADG